MANPYHRGTGESGGQFTDANHDGDISFSFDTAADAERWAGSHLEQDDLTLEEKAALGTYQAYTSVYTDINGALRADGVPENEEVLKQLDSAMAKAALAEPVVVWNAAETMDLEVGSVVTKKDFTSTTLFRDFAESFSAGEGDIWQFKLPKGSKARYMGKFDNEAEVLVNRGVSWRVKEIKTWSTGQRLIIMEFI